MYVRLGVVSDVVLRRRRALLMSASLRINECTGLDTILHSVVEAADEPTGACSSAVANIVGKSFQPDMPVQCFPSPFS